MLVCIPLFEFVLVVLVDIGVVAPFSYLGPTVLAMFILRVSRMNDVSYWVTVWIFTLYT